MVGSTYAKIDSRNLFFHKLRKLQDRTKCAQSARDEGIGQGLKEMKRERLVEGKKFDRPDLNKVHSAQS